MLVAPAGREFLRIKAGAAGTTLADGYQTVLDETGVKGHPFVKASMGHKVGAQGSPVPLRNLEPVTNVDQHVVNFGHASAKEF